jgi:hypothetical protein
MSGWGVYIYQEDRCPGNKGSSRTEHSKLRAESEGGGVEGEGQMCAETIRWQGDGKKGAPDRGKSTRRDPREKEPGVLGALGSGSLDGQCLPMCGNGSAGCPRSNAPKDM